MIYLLGLGDHLVGRSHECDYPAQVRDKPIIVDCALDLSTMSMAEIDTAVSRRLSSGRSLYHVHEARLRIAAPDLLLTQNLCQVCGPAGNEVSEVLRAMASAPKVIWQNPRSFEEVVETVRALGEETGTEEIAKTWAASATSQVQRISTMSSALRRVRVSFLEWVDPVYCGGTLGSANAGMGRRRRSQFQDRN
jgi:iron complex transport system substrate-binding protein